MIAIKKNVVTDIRREIWNLGLSFPTIRIWSTVCYNNMMGTLPCIVPPNTIIKYS